MKYEDLLAAGVILFCLLMVVWYAYDKGISEGRQRAADCYQDVLNWTYRIGEDPQQHAAYCCNLNRPRGGEWWVYCFEPEKEDETK